MYLIILLKRLFSSQMAKNAGWIILGRVIQMVLSLFVGLLTTRYLGPSNYGIINYASGYIALFMTFCTLGVNSILVKEFVETPEKTGELIGSTLLMRAIASFVSVLIIVCAVSIIDIGEQTTIVVTFLCSLGLIFNIFEVYKFWFQAKLKSKYTAIITLVAYVITSIYKIALLIMNKNVKWFAFATSIDYICISILYIVCYKITGGQKLSFSIRTSKNLVRQGYHFILPGIMIAIYGYADKFMLKHMMSDADVGFYATAMSISTMWCFVLAAIIESMTPSIFLAHTSSIKNYEKRNRQLYSIVFYVSMVVSLLISLFAEVIVNILYGEEFMAAAQPLKIVTWYTAFSYLGSARNVWIVCEEKQKYLKYIYITSAISNVFMNIIFIPVWGATGAAMATLITQIATVFIVPFFIKPLRRNSVLMIESIFLKCIKEKGEKIWKPAKL